MDKQPESRLVTESISTFLLVSREQEIETFGAHGEVVAILDRLNRAFDGIPATPIAGSALPPLLLSQAHGAFLAAVRMSLGGQVHVAHTVLRSCIESALYGLIMQRQPTAQEIWVNRSNDRKACRKDFTAQAGLAILKDIDAPLKQVFEEAYEVTIDNGAHPNVLSLGDQLDFSDWDDKNCIRNILLLPEDDRAVESVLHLCVVIGAAVASLCPYVMPDHNPAIEARREAMEAMTSFATVTPA